MPRTRAGLLDQVRRFANEHAMWGPGDRILVGVSGGPDSLCLLHLLVRMAPAQQLQLHVAHLDHGLRAEAAEDARFVAEISTTWSVPYTIGACDARSFSREYGGIEAAARAVRYSFLLKTAASIGATVVAIGHNADDQAETVIHRLLRGAGPTGLAAMRPALRFHQWRGIGRQEAAGVASDDGLSPALVRPLLRTPREEIEAYCAAQGLEPRRDLSNQSPEFLRNRVRGYIIPQLKAYNSNIVRALGRTARICAEEDALLADLVEQRWTDVAMIADDHVHLVRARFMEAHPALRRRILRRATMLLVPSVELGADHLDRMLRLVERRRGRLQLPGGLWIRAGETTITLERTADE